jgi:hypothetical protein
MYQIISGLKTIPDARRALELIALTKTSHARDQLDRKHDL